MIKCTYTAYGVRYTWWHLGRSSINLCARLRPWNELISRAEIARSGSRVTAIFSCEVTIVEYYYYFFFLSHFSPAKRARGSCRSARARAQYQIDYRFRVVIAVIMIFRFSTHTRCPSSRWAKFGFWQPRHCLDAAGRLALRIRRIFPRFSLRNPFRHVTYKIA